MTDDPETPSDTKLTRTKQAWARDGKFLTGRVTRPEAEIGRASCRERV